MVENFIKSCSYDIGSLKDFIYIIPYDTDLFSWRVDNGDFKELRMNKTANILKIEGSNVSLKNTQSLSGRFRYDSEVTIDIHELFDNTLTEKMEQLIKNKYFIVVEDLKGNQFLQSCEFYSEFEYNVTLADNNQTNIIQLHFKCSSNFSSMYMNEKVSESSVLIANGCQYINSNAYALKLCEAQYVAIEETNHDVTAIKYAEGHSFKQIDFNKSSFTFTENYTDGMYEDTITFSIPLSDYKVYFEELLTQFKANRYVATFRTEKDLLYILGYEGGMTPTYVIETSNSVSSLNRITITLRYNSTYGVFTSKLSDDDLYEEDDSLLLLPAPDLVNGALTKECIGNGMAIITLLRYYTASGAPLDEYIVLKGYEDRYIHLNVTGTYTLDDYFGFPLTVEYPACVGGECNTINGIVNPYLINKINPSVSFPFRSDCDFDFSGVPDWLEVVHIGDEIVITLKENAPDEPSVVTIYITTSDGTRYPITLNYTGNKDTTGWDVIPRETEIDSKEQYIYFDYSGVSGNDLEIIADGMEIVSVGDGIIVIKVPANNTGADIERMIKVTNKTNGESVNLKVIQSSSIEDWRTVLGYICENKNKYTRLELFVGGQPSAVYKKGVLIEEGSEDCKNYVERWHEISTICDGVNEYSFEVKQVSNDGGITWEDTSEKRVGKLIEERSEKCDPDHVQYRNTGEHICENGMKCEVWRKYIDGVAVDKTQNRNCVPSTECGEPTYKYELTDITQCFDRGDGSGICDRWYMLKEYASYDEGKTWIETGAYKKSDVVEKYFDTTCTCEIKGTLYISYTDKTEKWYNHTSSVLDFIDYTAIYSIKSAVIIRDYGLNIEEVSATMPAMNVAPSLVEISFPAVKLVNEHAFWGDTKLQSIYLPNAERIGHKAFQYAVYTSPSLNFPKVSYIDSYAFYGGAFKAISIPMCTYLGDYAFYGNINVTLTAISLDNVSYIGKNCFYRCENLAFIQNTSNVTEIGHAAFHNCPVKRMNLPLVKSLPYLGWWDIESVSLPNVEYLSETFGSCMKITTISLPKLNSLYNGRGGAFEFAVNLKNVYIGGSSVISEIPHHFHDTSYLLSIHVRRSLYQDYLTMYSDISIGLCKVYEGYVKEQLSRYVSEIIVGDL